MLLAHLLLMLAPANLPDLNALRWQARVLLIFASPGSKTLAEQRARFHGNEAEMQKRDLRLFEITGAAPEEASLRENLHVVNHGFTLLLIGKDGSIKLRSSEPVEAREIFSLIDSMPMRQDEMNAASDSRKLLKFDRALARILVVIAKIDNILAAKRRPALTGQILCVHR